MKGPERIEISLSLGRMRNCSAAQAPRDFSGVVRARRAPGYPETILLKIDLIRETVAEVSERISSRMRSSSSTEQHDDSGPAGRVSTAAAKGE